MFAGCRSRPHPGREADRDELAERLESPDRGLEQVAADRIDDDVDAQVVGDLVVEVRLGRAELAAEVELLRRAGRRDDLRAERARDLDRRGTDAAGRRIHEHGRAFAQNDLTRQRDVGGEEGEQERRALGERRVLGQRHERRAVDRRELGVAATTGERHHARPVLELAAELGADDRRELRHLRVLAAPDQDVGEVERGRTDVDKRLTVADLGVRDVLAPRTSRRHR